MKTYSEAQGEKPFNWFEELSKPNEDTDWLYLELLASCWVTCACGNQCDVIPRSFDGVPFDAILRNLGGNFSFYVARKDVPNALLTLKKIEKRSAELIKQINSN